MKKIKGMTWDNDRGFASLSGPTKEYQAAHPEVQIEWEARPLLKFGTQPIEQLVQIYDLIVLDHPFIGHGVKYNLIEPLNDYYPDEFLFHLSEMSVGGSYRSYEWEGKQWALPIDTAAQVAAYRSDLMEKYKYQVPKTWNDVFNLARSLPEGVKIAMPMCAIDSICALLSIAAQQNGNQWLEDQHDQLDEDVVAKALDFLREIKEIVDPRSLDMTPVDLFNHMSVHDDMIYTPYAFSYCNYSKDGYRTKPITFTDIPILKQNPEGTLLGGAGVAISKYSKHKSEAANYIKYLMEEKTQKGIYFQSGGQPGHRSAWLDRETN